MDMQQIVKSLGLDVLTPDVLQQKKTDVTTAYASDVMSDILSRCRSGGLLVTIMRNIYVVAVAYQAGLDGIIFAAGRRPEPEVIRKAEALGLILCSSPDSTFDTAGKLYALGLRGPFYR